MNIVYATDDNGALGTGVSIVSLMENLPLGVHADIYIMTDGLSGDNTARFHSLQQDYNLHLHFIDMKDKYTDFPVGSKWSAATYYRLGLAGELPATVERALYVDIDTIFNRDISPMYESEFGDCLIAGVFTTEDLSEESFSRWKREMNLDRDSIYINAGVILYHIGRIREERFESQVFSWAKNNIHRLSWQDQDILNVCYQQRILSLHPMWNICDGAIWSIRWEGVTSFRNNPLKPADLLEAARRPGIIHYWGHPKPWHPNSIRQDYGLFYKYWKKSPWKDDIRDFRKQNDPGRMFISKMRCLLGKGKRLLQGKHQ